jgi:hypothetical protein
MDSILVPCTGLSHDGRACLARKRAAPIMTVKPLRRYEVGGYSRNGVRGARSETLIYCLAGARRLRRSGRRLRCSGICKHGRGRRDYRWRGGAFAALPGLLCKSGLPANRDVFVAIGELGDDRPGDAGFGLRHQALQFRAAAGEFFALGLELLAVVQIVFGGIGKGSAHGVAHVGAAVEPEAKRKQRRRGGGAQQRLGTANPNDHKALGKATVLRLRKAARSDRIEALQSTRARLRNSGGSSSLANSIA